MSLTRHLSSIKSNSITAEATITVDFTVRVGRLVASVVTASIRE